MKNLTESIDDLVKLIKKNNNIVFLGGAGVSTASGIPDYRSKDGLYTKGTPEEMLSHDCLVKTPDKFYNFLKTNLIHKEAKPNNVHLALAELESLGKIKSIATQNIDGLHQIAGSKHVNEIHGNIQNFYCTKCKRQYDLSYILDKGYICSDCGCVIRPDVVLYGENIKEGAFNKAFSSISNADMIIIGGTSLSVYPFASLIEAFDMKNDIVILNQDQIDLDTWATLIIREDINEVFKKVRKKLYNIKCPHSGEVIMSNGIEDKDNQYFIYKDEEWIKANLPKEEEE